MGHHTDFNTEARLASPAKARKGRFEGCLLSTLKKAASLPIILASKAPNMAPKAAGLAQAVDDSVNGVLRESGEAGVRSVEEE